MSFYDKDCEHKYCHPECPTDFGGEPGVLNIRKATLKNDNFRRAVWTGSCQQTVLMCIPVSCDIGVEMHKDTDQQLYVVEGCAKFVYGNRASAMCDECCADAGDMIFVPRGTWHNIINTGKTPLKLFTTYAPPNHPKGTVECEKP